MNSGIYRFYKRLTAMLLAICMIAGLVMGQPSILSYASTELLDENLGEGGQRSDGIYVEEWFCDRPGRRWKFLAF